MPNPTAFTLPERFWAKTRSIETGCLMWQAALNAKGYGVYTFGGRTYLAHRLTYESAFGPIPGGLQIDHLCRVRACVNPGHLEAVTAAENNRRKLSSNAPMARITHVFVDRWGPGSAEHSVRADVVRRCPRCRSDRRVRT